MKKYIVINEKDNVAVAIADISRGSSIQPDKGCSATEYTAQDDIPAGHKLSLTDIARGDSIIKYGYTIGYATVDIPAGRHVHTQNLRSGLEGMRKYSYQPSIEFRVPEREAFFHGYRRSDGQVGIRNHIFIIPTVGCVNSVAAALAREAESMKPDCIDRVIAFSHPYGCSQLGDDQVNTLKILAALVNHPNAAGVLVIGLGCENCNLSVLAPYLKNYDKARVSFLQCQNSDDEIEEGLGLIAKLMEYAAGMRRERISAQELVIGLKCGGSDGLSGITANPLVGDFSDMLIACGGTSILTEVPEMFGAETILLKRCKDHKVFMKAVGMINGFRQYYISHDQPIYENPSPGNKQGGITTLEEKSLGCTQKSGSAPVSDVLDYGESVKIKGMNLLSAPGNDLVASTALAAAGAHIVLFTTGRGTPFGCPVPTVKISSNSDLAKRKANWIDFDAGRLLTGNGRREMAEELFELILGIASGRQVKTETAGFFDMAIFKQGVTL